MLKQTEYDKLVNKLVHIEDKILDIDKISKTLNIWVKENDYELIPIIKMLNNKIKDALKIIEK